jgi:hypothetical protein
VRCPRWLRLEIDAFRHSFEVRQSWYWILAMFLFIAIMAGVMKLVEVFGW